MSSRRIHIFVISYILCSVSMLAQNICIVSGCVKDAQTRNPISNATVICMADGNDEKFVTNSDGNYSLKLKRGCNTTIKISHLGYKTISKVVNCFNKRSVVDVELCPTEISLQEVVIKHNIPLITQRGDTTVYYARAYKVNADATAYDLISQKLPGVGQKDGKLEAHGEEVKEIRIDGREYFKNDINMALKNLPANIVEEIQIYDQSSDYSILTGFDDGNTKKTINIKTKNRNSKKTFGKAYFGYGSNDKYKLYNMYNLFNDDSHWSVFAQWNNINEQNFSIIDLLSATGSIVGNAPSQSPYSKGSADNTFHPTTSDDISSMLVDANEYGVTTSKALGTNYSNIWDNDNMSLSGHYLFNSSDNFTHYNIFDEYFGETASNNLQSQELNTQNTNHRFNSKYEYRISQNDYLLFRPTLLYQKKDEISDLTDWTVSSSDTMLLLNQTTATEQYVVGSSGEALYVHNFKNKHALAANVRISHMHTHEDLQMEFSNVQTLDSALQNTMCKNTQNTYTLMMSYICPITSNGRLKLDIGWDKNEGNVRRNTGIMKEGSDEYATDSLLSGSTWNSYGGAFANLTYQLNRKNLNFVSGVNVQSYELLTSNDRYYFKRNNKVCLPFSLIRYKLGNSQLHFRYKTSYKSPGLLQLHDAINNSNAIMAIRGNIKLEPYYHHNIILRFVSPNVNNGAIFVFFTNIEQADNYISSMRSLSSESYEDSGNRRNTEICSYKNSDGYFSCTSLLAYGFPSSLINSNINISSTVKYTKLPGYWDNNKVFTEQWNWNGSITIGSNISEKIDFVTDINAKYTNSTNISYKNMNIDYWSLSYGGQLNWRFMPTLKLVLEAGRTNYWGSGTSQYNALISNASLAYKFLKNDKGELRFSVHDIFNQDNSFYQTTTEIYQRKATTNIIGRYAMLTFTYKLNTTMPQIE